MTRRSVLPDYISTPGRGLRRATKPDLIFIKYHPISLEVGSYHKTDDEDRISIWNVCDFKKRNQLLARDNVC